MIQLNFTVEHNIHDKYSNKQHIHSKIRNRIYFAESMLLSDLKNDPNLNTRKIFKSLYMHTFSQSLFSLQEYNEKLIKITSFQILFSSYA